MQQSNTLPPESTKEHTAAGRAAPPLCQELMLRLKIVINTIIRKIRLCLDLNLLFQRRRHRSRSRDRLSGTEKKKVGKKMATCTLYFYFLSLSLSLSLYKDTWIQGIQAEIPPKHTHILTQCACCTHMQMHIEAFEVVLWRAVTPGLEHSAALPINKCILRTGCVIWLSSQERQPG